MHAATPDAHRHKHHGCWRHMSPTWVPSRKWSSTSHKGLEQSPDECTAQKCCCKAYKSFRMPTAASTDSTPCQAECLGAPLSLLSTDLLLHHHSAVKCQLIILTNTGCRYDLCAQSLFTSLRGLIDASHALLSAGHTPSCMCNQSESHKRSVSTHCSSKQSTMLSIIDRHAYSVR